MKTLTVGLAFVFTIILSMSSHNVEGAAFDKRAMNTAADVLFSRYDTKNKRPFCNAFTGCGYKRSDPSIDEEAKLLGKRLTGLDSVPPNQMPSFGGRMMFGMSRLRPTDNANQFGFFPGYLRK